MLLLTRKIIKSLELSVINKIYWIKKFLTFLFKVFTKNVDFMNQ